MTLWHTNYRDDGTGSKDFPFWFDIDMKKENTFKSFAYVPRQGAENGRIKGFELYVSNSLKDIEQPQNLVMKGELTMNGDAACWMNLPKEAKGRYIRFKEISSQNGLKYGTCAEFYVSKDNYIDGSYQLKPSAMKLNGVKEENIEGGKRLVFDLAPYQANNIDWDVHRLADGHPVGDIGHIEDLEHGHPHDGGGHQGDALKAPALGVLLDIGIQLRRVLGHAGHQAADVFLLLVVGGVGIQAALLRPGGKILPGKLLIQEFLDGQVRKAQLIRQMGGDLPCRIPRHSRKFLFSLWIWPAQSKLMPPT